MDSYNMEYAAKRLVELRDCRTRTGVARAIGISVSRLQTYEEGRRRCPVDVRGKLADYYGVSTESIFLPLSNA